MLKVLKYSLLLALLFGCAQLVYLQTPQQLMDAGQYSETRHIGGIDKVLGCINKIQDSKIDKEWVLRSQQLTSEKDRELLFFSPKNQNRASHLGVYARVFSDGSDTKIQWWVSKVFVSPQSVLSDIKGTC